MIYGQPGETREVSADNLATGQVGTLGVRITTAPSGPDILARTTAGITEYPVGSGMYSAVVTLPATAGDYFIIWDTGGGSPKWYREELRVMANPPTPVAGGGLQLISLNQLKDALGVDRADTSRDNRYNMAITQAAGAIADYCDRDFGANEVTEIRSYNLEHDRAYYAFGGYSGVGILEIDDCHAGTITAVTLDGVALDSTKWAAEPDRRSPVHYWLKLPPARGISPAMGFTYNLDNLFGQIAANQTSLVTVAATWGWPTVPTAVQQAAVWTAAAFAETPKPYLTQTFQSYSVQLPNPLTDAIPARAQALLEPYQRLRL